MEDTTNLNIKNSFNYKEDSWIIIEDIKLVQQGEEMLIYKSNKLFEHIDTQKYYLVFDSNGLYKKELLTAALVAKIKKSYQDQTNVEILHLHTKIDPVTIKKLPDNVEEIERKELFQNLRNQQKQKNTK